VLAARLARIYGDPPAEWEQRVVFVLAGDHGVAVNGVSAYPAAVTAQMCRNYAAGGAAICAMARAARVEVVAVDLGVNAGLDDVPGLVHRKVRPGTRDLTREAAMTESEARQAIAIGAALVRDRRPMPDMIGLGEMGIGNTTSASALTAALTGTDPSYVTGRGTGVDAEVVQRKAALVRSALSRLPDDSPPLRILAELGGLEIAGLVGVVLGAAASGRAVVVDGFIAAAAALVAVRMAPGVRPYLFASHQSAERGHRVLLRALRLRPLFRLGMRLGEGTGAVLAIPILDAAAALLRHMATFESAGVSSAVAREA
jgi:nicotinate-nucleotide--dimethylbenzimidazole phosphoribosyltransferase